MRNLLAATLALTLLVHGVALAQAAPPQAQPPKVAPTQAAPAKSAPTTPQKPPAGKPAVPGPVVPGPVVPVEPGFTIGTSDVLGILVWREPEMSGDIAVRLDGMISLPLIRDIQAAGLTPNELAERIQTAAREFVTDASVTVVVRQMNSRRVFITGEVARPGVYSLASSMTVMQLIAVAGGLSEFADSKNIAILRVEVGRTTRFPFDYKNVANGKKPAQNIELKSGDTVVVPER
jgi:polysaccharide export outer membrane protein